MTQIFYATQTAERRVAADAERLKEKWAEAHFSHRGLGAISPPTSPEDDEDFFILWKKCSHLPLLAMTENKFFLWYKKVSVYN